MEYSIKKNGNYESIEFNSSAIQTQGKSNITLQARVDDNDYANYLTITKCNTVTKLDIPDEVTLKLISRHPFNYTIPGVQPKYLDKHKVEDYLYEITYGNIDYKYAYEHFKPTLGGCSAIRNGNFLGRNFDWLYNNQVQFIVHTPTTLNNRYSVLGVSGIIPGVEKSNVDNEDIIIDDVDMFKLVPFYLLDGINECGVFCTHNIVPLDNDTDPTLEITAKKEEKDRVNAFMLPRFILDKFSTAEKAIDYLINYTTIYFSDEVIEAGYQNHLLLGDYDSTYVIEFINEEIVVNNKQKYITNFNITGVQFDKYNHIQYPPTEFGMNKYGMGLERWDLITDMYPVTNTMEGMRQTLDLVKYSNGYTWDQDEFWYSEIVGMDDDTLEKITVDTDPQECTTALSEVMVNWDYKDRSEPNVWITCHSSIYDISQKKLYIKNQEGDIEYQFNI